MSPNNTTIDPVFSDTEREELGHLDYLASRLGELKERGLIAPEAWATVVAEGQVRRQLIERSGQFQSALVEAKNRVKKDPRGALEWATRARELDPNRPEAWKLLVGLQWDLGDHDGAIARCAQAAEHLPQFQEELSQLKAARDHWIDEERQRAEKARLQGEIAGWLADAKLALDQGRDADVIAVGQQILAVCPDSVDALALTAFAQKRSGKIDEALATYQTLVRVQPSNTAWPMWVRDLKVRRGLQRVTGQLPEAVGQADSETNRAGRSQTDWVDAAPLPISWSSFAGEFLKAHSQELLLCLAVLLIVVSSTVGAHLLLGDLLWSPVGKCALAMVATLLFASFGAGLLRWGADRAGRMMLIATLIVVPIHFMLAGEMKLLHQPSAFRLAYLVVEGVAIVAMVRWVSGMLAPPSGARFLTAALLLLSVGSATTARESPLAWELQFASFQLSPVVFLGAVWALGARRWGDTSKEQCAFVYMMLGLLGFALLACLVRTGAYALRLDVPLYALPVMLVAVACVHTARRLAVDEPDTQRLALLRFGGFGLSGLAFALALASPPIASAIFSANMLAVAVVGLGLYVASLRIDRQPVYLYLATGAVVAGRLGAHYFVADRLHAIEEVVRQLLGYTQHLPVSFIALLGIVPNTALACLSLWFIKHWDDRRLARHCHYIGLPLSIAACIGSAFEPLAALMCMSAYTILYLLAIWVFAAPWVTYLAAAALAGACYFGTTMVPGITLADQALAASLLGFAFWAARVELRRRQAAAAYHVPWLHAALALTGAAMAAATAHLAFVGVGSLTGAGAFVGVATLALLLNRERPRVIWAQLALLSFVEFTICGVGLAMGIQNVAGQHIGLLFVADALTMLAAAELLRSWLSRYEPAATTDQPEPVGNTRWVGTILAAIPRSAIILTLVADALALFSIDRTWLAGLVFLLGALPLLWLTRMVRWQSLVYIGLAQFIVGTLDLVSCAVGWNNPTIVAGCLALTGAALGLALWGSGVALRRIKLSEFYSEPCLQFSFALTVGAYIAALDARFLGREAYALAAAALGVNLVVTMLLARTWRTAELTYVGVFHLVTATYLVLFSVGKNDPSMAYVLGLFAVALAIVLWGIGLGCQRLRDAWVGECARPLYHWAVGLTGLAVLLSDRSSVVLALVGISLLLAVKSLPRAEWLYGTVAALLAAMYFRWLGHLPPIELIGCATVAALGLWSVGVLIQRHKPTICDRLGLRTLAYEFPLFHSSIVVALIALGLRIGLSVDQRIAWTSHGWFPLALAGLSLIMLRAYPRRVCVHASLAFLTWTVVAAIVPSLTSVCFLTLAGLLLALGLLLIDRTVRPFEPALCARLGVVDAGYSTVVHGWALGIFGLAMSLVILVVVGEMSASILGTGAISLALTPIDWWVMLATLGLAGVFLMTLVTDPEAWIVVEPEHFLIALHWLSVAVLWWLGVGCSPLAGRVIEAEVYFPLATAVAALATARIFTRHVHDQSWHEYGWLGDLRFQSMERLLSIQACVLAALALVFTKGAVEPVSAVTLVLVSFTLGTVAVGMGWQAAALLGSTAWSAAWGVTGLVVARQFAWQADRPRALFAAVGVMSAAFSLLTLAGRLRRDPAILTNKSMVATGRAQPELLAWAMEMVALASSLFATSVVLAAAMFAPAATWEITAGVGVIMSAALLQILLVPRWQGEWLIYLAQSVMLLAYVEYRLGFPQPIATDAIVLTLLGYLDLGIAGVLERSSLKVYARPARFFSLVLPGLPLLEVVARGGLDEVSLFHLLAAGTFYGIACGQLRWNSLGYAAAVLYNAGLWVLWSRLGWRLSTHPQFFMVPVGLSTILFAEVNRSQLGRSNVNTIRTVGLTIIYLSLAVPIWQYDSFGAWVSLLIGSLVGIFLGIGLRLQTFLWMGLTTFVLDVIYEMGRVSLDYALAKWAIMLALGIALVMFVALNEKKRIVGTMRLYFDQARLWE